MRSTLNFEKKKNYNSDMIVIHVGILMYTVEDAAERGLSFLKI